MGEALVNPPHLQAADTNTARQDRTLPMNPFRENTGVSVMQAQQRVRWPDEAEETLIQQFSSQTKN